jgi:hypothetical protein
MAGLSVKNCPVGNFSEEPGCWGGQFRHPLQQAEFFFEIGSIKFILNYFDARMAELVDALVSNTSGSNTVPVRSRLRVQRI